MNEQNIADDKPSGTCNVLMGVVINSHCDWEVSGRHRTIEQSKLSNMISRLLLVTNRDHFVVV